MVSEKFRFQLMKEAQKWQEENIINSTIFDQLSARYQFDQLATATRNRFIIILLSIGSFLLGLAVITFVAANWQEWTREIKVIILVGFFLIANIGAFYLWKNSVSGWQHRLGLGLFLLGALIFGANLGLMSQLFHQSGAIYQLYLIWGIGVIAMAFGLRITSLSIFGIILLTISYLWGYSDIFYSINQPLIFQILIKHFPLIIGTSLICLAYWCQSPWTFGLTVFLINYTFVANLITNASQIVEFSPFLSSLIAVSASCLIPAFFYAYQENLWTIKPLKSQSFATISRYLALFFLGGLFYIFSFKILWENSFSPNEIDFNWYQLLSLIDPLILFGLTLLAWWRLGLNNEQKIWKIDINSTAIAALLFLTSICLIIHITFTPIGWLGIFIFNVFLGLFAIGLIRESLSNGKRGGFWYGIILLVLQIFSRTVEYDTSLLLKAFVFFLCGIGIIIAGLWFEKYVKNLNQS